MKYFKSPADDVFAYESDGSQDAWIRPDLVPMTPEEVEAHLNPPAPQPSTILSSREYLMRFTNAEYAAVRSSDSIDLHRAYDSLIAAQFVDLTDPAVGMGLDLMISAGIIDADRKAELLQPEPAA
ncbi:hypothetical protein [Castellaniella caeni]|uniref:hypothetical protein n=1 Tax=Castellaniella caeni TaxID=266123 RepID=UPI0012ED6855|nr:hypothetical protein [Castellaniella caeni]